MTVSLEALDECPAQEHYAVVWFELKGRIGSENWRCPEDNGEDKN
jgi:hypothetical protein